MRAAKLVRLSLAVRRGLARVAFDVLNSEIYAQNREPSANAQQARRERTHARRG